MSFRIGFDIGGTKIEAALLRVSGERYEVLSRRRVPTEREKGYDSIMSKVKDLYQEAVSHIPSLNTVESVGVGLPGTIDPTTFIMYSGNTNAFVGKDLKKDFGSIFKNSQRLVCANDANCFALAEAHYGAGLEFSKNSENVLGIGVILGTGCGGGIVYKNKLIEGKFGGAAEIGHTVLVANGRNCYCGRRGCAETYISGTGLQLEYSEVSGQPVGSFKGADVFERALADEVEAVRAVTNYRQHLAEFLSNMTNVFDPDYFLLGGGVSQQKAIYDGLENIIADQRLIPVGSPKVFQNKLGDSAGVIGAALL